MRGLQRQRTPLCSLQSDQRTSANLRHGEPKSVSGVGSARRLDDQSCVVHLPARMRTKKRQPQVRQPAQKLVRQCVRLEEQSSSDAPIWVQIAKSGVFKGYQGGEVEFTFDALTFSQLIANFRSHPAYQVGSDGVGTEPVIAWDFNHASEMDPTAGSLPTTGAPAQGWILDLEVRQPENGTGELELWALTKWLEPARTYIKEGRYRWASVSVVFDAVDPVGGQVVGAVLSSVAATNTPFLEGMEPLAADRWYGPVASGPEEAASFLKNMFRLPALATLDEVRSELAKLAALPEDDPIGRELFDSAKGIFGLPILTSAAEVLAYALKVLTPPQPATPGQPEVGMTTSASNIGDAIQMSLLKLLSQKLGTSESEGDVVVALEALLARSSPADKARNTLEPRAAAMGIQNADDAVASVTGLIAKAAELEKVLPELASLRQFKAAQDEEDEKKDVEEAMASRSLNGDGLKLALRTLRKADPTGFKAQFPKIEKPAAAPAPAAPAAPAVPSYLTRPLASYGNAEVNADGSIRLPQAPGGDQRVKIDLSGVGGVNRVLKLMAWVKAQPGGEKLSHEEVSKKAFELNRNAEIVRA